MTTTTPTTTNDGLKRGILALLAMTGVAGGVLLVLGAAEKKSSTALARASNPVDVAAYRAEALIRAVADLPDGVSSSVFLPLRNAIQEVRSATKRRAEAMRELKKQHHALVRFVKDNWSSDEIARVDWSEVT